MPESFYSYMNFTLCNTLKVAGNLKFIKKQKPR